ALLRPGRFDVEIQVPWPDLKGRIEIFSHYLSKIKTDVDVNAEALAKSTVGFSGAEIENMINQAALKAASDNKPSVDMHYLDMAHDFVRMGPARKALPTDKDTNLNTAYHEAGHALVAYFTKDSVPLHKVTIIPRGQALG
uniref:Uncharacterized protein n=1 Tax=Romanomermis culicivorax TaxID=13658 RepID=A0A915JG36_ROMCU